MIFTSLEFLAFFVVLLILLAIFRADKSRLYLLIAASYYFYGAWNIGYLALIFLCSLWGWGLGALMVQAKSPQKRSFYLIASIILSLGMLAYYKYANFITENVFASLDLSWQPADILLPVGISFFTFQTMSYTIDLYRGRIEPCHSFPRFMLFVSFFPQLVAGPIVRSSEFLPQLDRHIKIRAANVVAGSQIFLGGALQKVLVADNLSIFVDRVFADPALYSSSTLWLALLGYSVQIFCDFSGYSLMAIGIARILGFELPQNFRMPYISQSITEFWRRWHISLSSWLRDYLYISLGGNRSGAVRTYVNLMITMLLGGLWHGASWNFVLWGALHGLGLVVHKLWIENRPEVTPSRIYRTLSWGFSILYVALLWVPFRSSDFATTLVYYERLFTGASGITWLHTDSLVILGLVFFWHVLYLSRNAWLRSFPSNDVFSAKYIYPLFAAIMLIVLFAPVNTSPFIYFQF